MIILKHLFVIFIPGKTLATSSEYVRKLANFVLIYCMARNNHAYSLKLASESWIYQYIFYISKLYKKILSCRNVAATH